MTDQPATPATPVTPATRPYNVLAIVGFVLSILGFNIIAIILGAVGLSQIKKSGDRGRGFALAAIWIGVISIVLAIIVIIAAIAIAAANAGAA
jgi:peptidyl-prolyl cis-trans isomerase B (cyclophilin B)